jgi:transcriptional regulator with XRE-family HTH domain
MSQTPLLLSTLKRELKARGITYAQVARQLELSESSIKRVFASSQLSLKRLEQLCQLAGMEISDLVQKMAESRNRIDQLTVEQEREVAASPKLLLVAVCILNHWTYQEILDEYRLDENECIQILARLDRLKIIELLPLNRFKVIVASDFRWIANGPIQDFFRREVQPDFMRSAFTGAGEKLLFRNGMLSRGSSATMIRKMERLMAEFNELHGDDAGLPLPERFGTSIMVAMRPWEFSYFRELRRNPDAKVFR